MTRTSTSPMFWRSSRVHNRPRHTLRSCRVIPPLVAPPWSTGSSVTFGHPSRVRTSVRIWSITGLLFDAVELLGMDVGGLLNLGNGGVDGHLQIFLALLQFGRHISRRLHGFEAQGL